MWIHLKRVRSTFSKSLADTSGRFLGHRTEKRGLVRAAGAGLLVTLAAWPETGFTVQDSQLQEGPVPVSWGEEWYSIEAETLILSKGKFNNHSHQGSSAVNLGDHISQNALRALGLHFPEFLSERGQP